MNKRKYADPLIYLLIIGIVIFIWYYVGAWIDTNINPGDLDAEKLSALKGQYGDKFGAVNALFSGLAFAGIIITLLLQKRDLSATRDAMGHERFDSTFFQLLTLHMDITKSITSRARTGIQAFEAFTEHLKTCDSDFYAFSALQKISRDKVRAIIDARDITEGNYSELNTADVANLKESLAEGVRTFENFLDSSIEMHEEKIVRAYVKSCIENIDTFSHYFRSLYHILKFIDDSKLSQPEKHTYSKFLRSQLSDAELVCLFYNSISQIALPGREHMELGFPKMQAYLKKFDILQNMNPRSLIHPIHQKIFEKNKRS